MHSNSSNKTASNCTSSNLSTGKNCDPFLRQSTGMPIPIETDSSAHNYHYFAHRSQFESPIPSPSLLPPSPSAIPYDMSSPNSCVQCPSIRTTTSSYSSSRAVNYVYELPYNVRKSICDLLDADNSWRELGGRYMGFNDTQLTLISHALYRSSSPTNELLTKWESSNAKVAHLYLYLAHMKHRRAMFHLLAYVNDKLKMMYDAFDEHQFDSVEQRSQNDKLDNLNINSFKNSSIKHSTLKDIIHEDVEFFPNNKKKNHSEEEEKTLVDLKGNKKNTNIADLNRLNKDKLDYLVRIDDFKISYKELVIATDGFCKDNILGSGGFGTVYMGEWKGTKVAVKKLKGLNNLSQALTELRILNCCRIDNILPLYAVSLDGPEPCLVYQFMPNGSLEDRLLCKNNTPPLTWLQRARIGEGIARALNFLHTLKGNPFVHGDVKSANILLDPLFEAKLGDFGLARQVMKNTRNENSLYTHCTVSSVNGTSVYLPPEYLRLKILSPAVDVYSYGIVMLEMATGRRAYDGKKLLINLVEDEYIRALNHMNSGKNSQSQPNEKMDRLSNDVNVFAELIDKRISHLSEDRHWFNYLLELGRKCAHKTKSKRPIMIQVLEYFNQCKTTDRIHRLCDKAFQNRRVHSISDLSKSNLKTPLELQLWYDFVRKSCGTLSDVVFENFGAQVTKMIEDLNSFSDSAGSSFCLDILLNSKGCASVKQDGIKLESDALVLSEEDAQNSLMGDKSKFNEQMCSFVSSVGDPIANETEPDNLPEMLQYIKISNSDLSANAFDDSRVIMEAAAVTNKEENSDQFDGVNNDIVQSIPSLPLLTALGLNSVDIEELMKK